MASKKEIYLIQKIMELSIKINMQSRYNVWCEFHGHVNSIDVLVTGKYDKGSEPVDGWDNVTIYLSTGVEPMWRETMERVIEEKVERLEGLRHGLSKFLSKGKSKS